MTEILERERVGHEAATLRLPEIARYLQTALGQKIVAYLAGLNDAKMVGQWIQGVPPKSPLVVYRLRSAYEAARVLMDSYDTETARAWFFGTNAQLGDVAPAYKLRHAQGPEDWQLVPPAAYSFVEGMG